MPSEAESEASLRKQEIGRPRLVPPLESTGVAGMNQRLARCSRRAAGRGPCRRRNGRRPGKEILKGFARHQIAVLQGGLAEHGQQVVAAAVESHLDAAFILELVTDLGVAEDARLVTCGFICRGGNSFAAAIAVKGLAVDRMPVCQVLKCCRRRLRIGTLDMAVGGRSIAQSVRSSATRQRNDRQVFHSLPQLVRTNKKPGLLPNFPRHLDYPL